MKLLLSLGILLISFLLACETEMDVPEQNHKSLLVANSLLGTDSLFTLTIGASSNNQENENNLLLADASVNVHLNGIFLGTMQHKEKGKYELPNVYLNKNQNYQISASHPKYPTVEANFTSLEKVEIKNATTRKEPEDNKLVFSLQFTDNALQDDYYMVFLKGVISNTTTRNLNFFSDDIIFNGNLSTESTNVTRNMIKGSRSFSDIGFNGEEINLSIFLLNSTESISYQNYQIELYHITEEYYNYERSYVAINNRSDLMFQNKINLYSNVYNGYGIVTNYAVDKKTVQVN